MQHRNNGEARLEGRRQEKKGEPRTLSASAGDTWHVQSTMLGPQRDLNMGIDLRKKRMGDKRQAVSLFDTNNHSSNPSLWSGLFSWCLAFQNRETTECNESWTTYQLCLWKLSSPYLTTRAKQRLISLRGWEGGCTILTKLSHFTGSQHINSIGPLKRKTYSYLLKPLCGREF